MRTISRPPPLARAHRHPVALAGWLLLAACLVGVGGALLIAAPPDLPPRLLLVASISLLLLLLLAVCYPLAAWALFSLEAHYGCVLVRELQGLRVRVQRYPLESTSFGLERMPWDYLLGTGTVVLLCLDGKRRLRLLTPISWFDQIIRPHPIRR